MKFRNILILLIIIFANSCAEFDNTNFKTINSKLEKKYKNSGFTLIYNENLDIKILDDRSLYIYHKHLKKKSFVKITNPVNGKSLIAQVKSNKIKFSNFYNSVITDRISETLELNIEEPFIEIVLISKNSTFIAKKQKLLKKKKK